MPPSQPDRREHAAALIAMRKAVSARDRHLLSLHRLIGGVAGSTREGSVLCVDLPTLRRLVSEITTTQADLEQAAAVVNLHAGRLGVAPVRILRRSE